MRIDTVFLQQEISNCQSLLPDQTAPDIKYKKFSV